MTKIPLLGATMTAARNAGASLSHAASKTLPATEGRAMVSENDDAQSGRGARENDARCETPASGSATTPTVTKRGDGKYATEITNVAINTGKLLNKRFGPGYADLDDDDEAPQGLSSITREELAAIGGPEGFLRVFVRFYEYLHADPLMLTLFNETPEERPAQEHGMLLGGFLLRSFTSDSTYFRMLHSGMGYGLGGGHARARRCPYRGQFAGRGFLRDQGFAWIGHLSRAIDEAFEEELKKGGAGQDKSATAASHARVRSKMLTTLVPRVWYQYGPWVDA